MFWGREDMMEGYSDSGGDKDYEGGLQCILIPILSLTTYPKLLKSALVIELAQIQEDWALGA